MLTCPTYISYCTNPGASCSFLLLYSCDLFLFRLFICVCCGDIFPPLFHVPVFGGRDGLAWPVKTRHGIIPRHRGTGFAGGSALLAGDLCNWHRVPGRSDGLKELY